MSRRCMRRNQDSLDGPIGCNYVRRVQGRYVKAKSHLLWFYSHVVRMLYERLRKPPTRVLGREGEL